MARFSLSGPCCLLSLSSSDWASRTPGRPSEAEICTAYIAGVMMVTISARCEVADRERWTQAVRLVRLECAPAVWSMAWANCRFRPRGRIGAIPTTLLGGIDHSRSASRWSKLPEPFMPAEALGRTLRPAIGNARLWPDRARSQEISVASSDGTTDGRYRNITYERRLERRTCRWLPADEIATNGGRVRTPFGPPRSRACSRAS